MFISNVDGMFGGVKMANHGMFWAKVIAIGNACVKEKFQGSRYVFM